MKKVLYLYACPSELIPDTAKEYHGKIVYPAEYARQSAVRRAMSKSVVSQMSALALIDFEQASEMCRGSNKADFIASCLLPIFSTSKHDWEKAIDLMREMITDADTVIAIPYNPKRIGYTGDSHFDAADYMCSMVHGFQEYNVVKWETQKDKQDDVTLTATSMED